MDIQNDKEVACELFKALKDDTTKVNELSADALYSIQLKSGIELIVTENFSQMGLKESLLNSLYKMGLEKPTVIQNLAIPQIIKGHNLAFHSKSGTGKTIAFTVGALQRAEPGKGVQVIILAPTRELCIQIGGVIESLAGPVGLTVCVALRNFVSESITEEIVVASPGKVIGLINNKVLDPKNLLMIIMDEADELISNQAFGAQTLKLLKTHSTAQKIFFSATYSEFSQNAVKKLVPDCSTFFEKNAKADKIQLYFIEVNQREKINTVKSLFECLTIAQTIIFAATKNMVDTLSRELANDGFSVSVIHGGLEPLDRDRAFQDFLAAKTKILVTTDVFSRGMDIPQVNLIINFDLPSSMNESIEDSYIHRVGRSGRFNRVGFVIDLISNDDDMQKLVKIMTYSGSKTKKFTIEALKEVFAEEAFS